MNCWITKGADLFFSFFLSQTHISHSLLFFFGMNLLFIFFLIICFSYLINKIHKKMIMELKNKKIRWWRSSGGSPETNPRRSSRSTSRHHLTCAQAQRHTIFGISPSRHRLEFAVNLA